MKHKKNILLVEDHPGDIRLTIEALKECNIKSRLHVTTDGVSAIQFLNKAGEYEFAPTPDLILLDLNLPKLSGFQILEYVKSNPELKVIPVIILSTSGSSNDILKSYEKHVNCFVTKPTEFNSFTDVIKNIGEFWFSMVQLPNRS